MRIALLFFLFSYSSFYAQSEGQNENLNPSKIAFSMGLERNDIFASCDYLLSFKNRLSINPSLSTGFIHSFIQMNPFINVAFNSYYNIVNKRDDRRSSFFLGIGGGYGYSFYRLPVHTNFNQIRLSYLLVVGKNFQFFQKGGLGLMMESFNGMNRSVSLLYPNFHFSIGLCYAF